MQTEAALCRLSVSMVISQHLLPALLLLPEHMEGGGCGQGTQQTKPGRHFASWQLTNSGTLQGQQPGGERKGRSGRRPASPGWRLSSASPHRAPGARLGTAVTASSWRWSGQAGRRWEHGLGSRGSQMLRPSRDPKARGYLQPPQGYELRPGPVTRELNRPLLPHPRPLGTPEPFPHDVSHRVLG